jgi:hypothetical protein
MNKGIILIFVIILLALLIWDSLSCAYFQQKMVLDNEIAEKPVLLISNSSSALDSLGSLLQNHSLVNTYSIERDSLISNILIETYRLEKARNILSKYDLPDVMKIYLKGSTLDIHTYLELENMIKLKYPDVIYRYNIDHLLKHYENSIFLLNSYYAANGILMLFLLLLLIFLRYHFEVKKNNYWKIFIEAGGYSNYRNKQFWLNSLLLCIVPLLLTVGVYYLLFAYKLIIFTIDPYLFLIQFSTLLLSTVISRIPLGVKN